MSTLPHKCLGKFGYIVHKDKLDKDTTDSILADLTVKTSVLPAYKDFQKPKVYKIYYHTPTVFYLPRFYGISRFGEPEYMSLSLGVPLAEGVRCGFEPLKHQATALTLAKAIFDPTKQAGDGGVLSLPCGYGKTFCAIKIVCDFLGLSALIVVPTECLMEQWCEAIVSFAPNAKVGIIQRDHIDVEGKDFVVAMLHSLCLKDYPPATFSRFGITIFDECHHIGSETFCKAMMKIRTRFVLGLSATPERRDGLSHVFYKFIGPLFHKERRSGSNVVYIKKLLLDSSSKNYEVLRMGNGTVNTACMTTALAELETRNRLIVFVIRQMISQGRKILLISSRKRQLHTIKEYLDEAGIKHPMTGHYITYGFYYGKKGMSKVAHKALLAESARCDVVLGIDVIAKEGLDIPDRNTLIFATPPGTEVEQPVGRILRRFHTDLNPMVIDLVDCTGNYDRHSKERDTWYTEEGYIIQSHSHNLDDPVSDSETLMSYIHTKMPAPERQRTPPAETPNFARCMVGEPIPPVTKVKKVRKPAPKVSTGPRLDSCLLADHSAIRREATPSNEPDFSSCFI